MLSVDGDADAVVEARIRIGWNKFRQLVPLLTNKDVSLSASRDENGQVDVCIGGGRGQWLGGHHALWAPPQL